MLVLHMCWSVHQHSLQMPPKRIQNPATVAPRTASRRPRRAVERDAVAASWRVDSVIDLTHEITSPPLTPLTPNPHPPPLEFLLAEQDLAYEESMHADRERIKEREREQLHSNAIATCDVRIARRKEITNTKEALIRCIERNLPPLAFCTEAEIALKKICNALLNVLSENASARDANEIFRVATIDYGFIFEPLGVEEVETATNRSEWEGVTAQQDPTEDTFCAARTYLANVSANPRQRISNEALNYVRRAIAK